MKYVILLLSLSTLASCASHLSREADNKEMLVLIKKCYDINLEIMKSDLAACEQESKNKGKISKGQNDKELRECRESVSTRNDLENKKCNI